VCALPSKKGIAGEGGGGERWGGASIETKQSGEEASHRRRASSTQKFGRRRGTKELGGELRGRGPAKRALQKKAYQHEQKVMKSSLEGVWFEVIQEGLLFPNTEGSLEGRRSCTGKRTALPKDWVWV